MKVLITGGSGFLGSHVSDELSKRGYDVIIFDQKKTKWLSKGQKFVLGKINNINDKMTIVTIVTCFRLATTDSSQRIKLTETRCIIEECLRP